MFKARIIGTTLAALVVFGVAVAMVSAWRPPGPRRPARDSYSGMVMGHRALLEVLEELGVDIVRSTDSSGYKPRSVATCCSISSSWERSCAVSIGQIVMLVGEEAGWSVGSCSTS